MDFLIFPIKWQCRTVMTRVTYIWLYMLGTVLKKRKNIWPITINLCIHLGPIYSAEKYWIQLTSIRSGFVSQRGCCWGQRQLNGTYVIEHPGWFSWMHRIYSSSRISQDLPDTGLLIHLSHSKQYAWFRETKIGPSIITLDQLYMLLS